MRIAVDSSAQGTQALLFELSTKRLERVGAFGHLGGTVDDGPPFSFHHCKNAFAPIDIRPIHQKIAMSSKGELRRRRAFQPIPDDAPGRALAVTTLSRKLSDAVALDDPALKPYLFAQLLVGRVLPDKRVTALAATKPLSLFKTLSMSPHPPVPTVRTVPFLPSQHPRLLKAFNLSIDKSPITIGFYSKRATDFGHYSRNDKQK